MALTGDQHVALACEAAHSPGKVVQARQLLNSILSDLCQIYDFAEARGDFLFTFDPVLNVGLNPNVPPNVFGSGPYLLPADYLRMSGSSGSSGAQRSFIWWLNGVPYPIIPCDLAEFDMQVQQAGLNSYVWLGATDMSAPIDDRILLTTTANVTQGNPNAAFLADTNRLIPGRVLGIAGQGIPPGARLVSIAGDTIVMDQPANATITGASIFFGYPPTVWIYPPPASAQQARIRYQKRMPDMTDFSRNAWCHFDGYIQKKLIEKLCDLNDDSRAAQYAARAQQELTLFLGSKDDDQSRPKIVQLDRRTFGQAWPKLQTTKTIGWP
jgi:hypothetical protein